MIRRKGQRWELYPHKVRYTNSLNEEETNTTKWATPSQKWWEELAESHEHIEVHEFIEVEVTEAMKDRFEEVEYMGEDYQNLYIEYVLTGKTLEVVELPISHPFNIIKLKREQVMQDEYLIDLDFRQSLSEMGVDVNDL